MVAQSPDAFCESRKRSCRRVGSQFFTAQPGQVIALVGHTGSGKSTIIGLLAKFQLPDSGVIRLDDLDLAEIRQLQSLADVNEGLGIGPVCGDPRRAAATPKPAPTTKARMSVGIIRRTVAGRRSRTRARVSIHSMPTMPCSCGNLPVSIDAWAVQIDPKMPRY